MYDVYRKRGWARRCGELKWVDLEICIAIGFIIAIIIFTTRRFIYGFIGLCGIMMGDALWFIIRDIETLPALETGPRDERAATAAGVSPSNVSMV